MHLNAQFSDNYIWLVRYSQYDRNVIIIDPGEARPVIEKLKLFSLTPVAILVTHGCHDHVDGISKLCALYDIPVYGSAIENVPRLTHPVIENDVIPLELGDSECVFKVLDVPGHKAGHVAYYGQGELFCGDTLFGAGCGRVFNSTAQQLYYSLQKIAMLPDSTKIYCSHEYTLQNLNFATKIEPQNVAIQNRMQDAENARLDEVSTVPSTLLMEKATNPFLRCDIPEVIAAAEAFSGERLITALEVFVVLRFWKDTH